MTPIPIIDIFAGPGGLGEGFSQFSCQLSPNSSPAERPFHIALSIEKDPWAHKTLSLRAFFRQFAPGHTPQLYYDLLQRKLTLQELPQHLDQYPDLRHAWQNAQSEARHLELSPATHNQTHQLISQALSKYPRKTPWILIGGPPCQAYSLAGRVRNNGKADYRIEDDHRSRLYEEYLKIIADHQPTVFVMENVTGLLSATLENRKIFEKILADLQYPAGPDSKLHYHIVPVVSPEPGKEADPNDPRRFIVRCEQYGVPQQRHRLILIGLRDTLKQSSTPPLLRKKLSQTSLYNTASPSERRTGGVNPLS